MEIELLLHPIHASHGPSTHEAEVGSDAENFGAEEFCLAASMKP